jgi:putative RNA 2'-phosphotransferase
VPSHGGRVGIVEAARQVRVSKLLSLVLRHEPGRIGIRLDPAGWVAIDELLAACGRHGTVVSREELEVVVAASPKQRFAIDPSGTLIRANQGHSVVVDLGYQPTTPPPVLFHGTARRSLEPILDRGLEPMARQHVHLSADIATATSVGSRHGVPVVLEVAAAAMHAHGHLFLRAANGVWLVDHVPSRFLRQIEPPHPRAEN